VGGGRVRGRGGRSRASMGPPSRLWGTLVSGPRCLGFWALVRVFSCADLSPFFFDYGVIVSLASLAGWPLDFPFLDYLVDHFRLGFTWITGFWCSWPLGSLGLWISGMPFLGVWWGLLVLVALV
jgi:hypothetical protein